MRTINEQLAAMRDRLRLTEDEVGARMPSPVTHSAVSKWENRSSPPRQGYIAWARALGCSIVNVVLPPEVEPGDMSEDDLESVRLLLRALPVMTDAAKRSLRAQLGSWSAEPDEEPG